MQKFLRNLMLTVAMLLPFASQAQVTYNFEDNAIPAGWENDAAHPWIVTATSQTDAANNTHHGTYCIMSGNAGISSSTSTITATFNFVAGGSISFYGGCWGEGTSTAWDKCIFKIDGVQQFANGALATWDTYSYTVSAGMHVFEWIYQKDASVNPTGDAFYIDDVVITGGVAPTCFNVQNLAVTATSSSSITLSWNDTLNTGATYTIYDMSDTSVVTATIVNNTAVIDGLDPNTAYTFGVLPDCGGGDYAGYATITVRTACSIITSLPQTWTFEAEELVGTSNAEALPYCWSRYNSTSSYNYYPYAYNSSTYAHTGNRSLYYYGTTSSSYPDTMVAIMPAIDVNTYSMDGNRLTFWARMGSATYDKTVYVGTMSNPMDPTTFVLADTVHVSGTTMTKYFASLATAPSTNANVAFVVLKSSGNLYIDDVTLEEMPSCFEVSNLTVVDSLTTTTSITLTWSDANNTGASYTVYNMSDTTEVVDYTIEDSTAVIENLDPSSFYVFGVQANCAAGDAAFTTVSTGTACGAVTMPWSENFDGWSAKSPCWSFLSGAYNNGNGPASASTSAWSLNSVYGNYITISGKALTMNLYNTLKYWAVTPPVVITDDDAVFSVDVAVSAWSAESPNFDDNDTLAIAISTDGGNTFTTLHVLAQNELNALTSTYSTILAPVTGHMGDTVSFAIFGGSISGTSPHDNRLVIDNISIGVSVGDICYAPTAMILSDVTTTSATLSWSGNASSYTIIDIATGTDVTTTDNSYTFTGLTATTLYTFGVVANCGSNTSDTIIVSFRTACAAVAIPFVEDFEANSNTLGCWSVSNIAASTGLTSSNPYSGSTAFVFAYNTNPPQYLISPELSGTENGVTVSFMYRVQSTSYPESFQLGYSTTTNDVTAFTWGTEQTNLTNLTYEAYSEILPAGTKYVSIKYTANDMYYLFIDSVAFDFVPSCLAVTNLTVDTVTATSVTLSWNDNNSGATYSVYGADGAVIASGITGTTYTITGLTALTGYTFGVVANCSETDASNVTLIDAVTACAGATCNLYIFAEDSYGDGWNGASIDVMQGGAVVANYTLLDTAEIAFVEVCASAPVSFVWNSGSYDDEASFLIFDINGDSLFAAEDASDLTDGAVFFTTATPCSEVSDEVTFTIAVNDATMGTTTPAPGIHTYEVGDTLIITAAANDGYRLAAWNLNVPGLGDTTVSAEGRNPINTIVNAALDGVTITAIFAVEVPEATIAVSDILYWVGEGSNQAVLAINWPDTALAWGYRFNGTATVQDMLDDIANADPRFSYSVEEGYLSDFYFLCEDGVILSGAMDGYWESKNNGISDMGLFQTLSNGDFEKWANSAAGVVVDSVYYEGWGWSPIYNYPMTIHPVSVPAAEAVTITFTVNDATMGAITPSGVQTYEVGDILTVTATPFEGYRLAAWQLTLDGETLIATEDITNTYTDTVFADIDGAIITAVFERETGIDDVEAGDFKAYSVDSRIVVKGVENMNVNIYDVTGRVVYNEAKAAETVEFTVPSAGVYMVKAGDAPAKRVVVVR